MKKDETIVAVRAETCGGPGWANRPLWVYIRNRVGEIRQECLQPEEHGDVIPHLFDSYEAMTNEMISQVCKIYRDEGM